MYLSGDTTLTSYVDNGTIISISCGNLKILSDIGNNVKINASHKLQICGNVGTNCFLHAIDYIEAHNICDCTQLTSDIGKIFCHELGDNVVITAQKTVTLVIFL